MPKSPPGFEPLTPPGFETDAPSMPPGFVEDEVINEQHPDLGWWERTKLQNVAPSEASKAKYLRDRLDYDVTTIDGRLAIKKPNEDQWYRIESDSWIPELSDITDIGNEVVSAIGTGLGVVGGAAASAPTGPGALAGGAAGGAAAAAAIEGGRMGLGKLAGFETTPKEALVNLGTEAVLGGATPVVAKGLSKFVGEPIKRGIGKLTGNLAKPTEVVKEAGEEAISYGAKRAARTARPFQEGGMIGVGRALQGPARAPVKAIEKAATIGKGSSTSIHERWLAQQQQERLRDIILFKADNLLKVVDSPSSSSIMKVVGEVSEPQLKLLKKTLPEIVKTMKDDLLRIQKTLKRPWASRSDVLTARDQLIRAFNKLPSKSGRNAAKALTRGLKALNPPAPSMVEQAGRFLATTGAPVATVTGAATGTMTPLVAGYVAAMVPSVMGKMIERLGYRWLQRPREFLMFANSITNAALRETVKPLTELLEAGDEETFRQVIQGVMQERSSNGTNQGS